MCCHDVAADRVGGNRHHVLARGIAGRELEAEIDVIALDGELHVDQLAVPRRFRRRPSEGLDRLSTPTATNIAGVAERLEGEARRAAHAFVEHERPRSRRPR